METRLRRSGELDVSPLELQRGSRIQSSSRREMLELQKKMPRSDNNGSHAWPHRGRASAHISRCFGPDSMTGRL